MTKLLAILLSLAMMLTGATAPVAEPVSRSLKVSNLTVRHNNDEVTLSPSASLGVMTDGAKAVFDFFVANGADVYLPFQAIVDESGLLVYNDNSGAKLKLDEAQLDALLEEAGGIEADEESQQVFALIGDYMSAYADMLRLAGDAEAIQTLQERADGIYDEMVDRGEGVVGTAEYEDEIYEVTTYEYDLTGTQLGALVDAVYATDERLANYAAVYFKVLNAMPEDSGLSGLDSFESLMAAFDIVSLHVTESIAEDGLDISDIILHIAVPEQDAPLEFVIHAVESDEERTVEMAGDINIDGMAMSLYLDGAQSGRDMQMGLSLAMNPESAAADEEGDEELEAVILDEDEEADEEADDEDDEIVDYDDIIDYDDLEDGDLEIEVEPVDGEGDDEDAVYFTMDCDISYDEDAGETAQSISYALDMAEEDLHMEFAIDGAMTDDGEGQYQVSGELATGEDTTGFEFDAAINGDDIEARADDEGAASLDNFDTTALLASVSADALNLYKDQSVQKLIAMIQTISSGTDADDAEEAEVEEDVDDDEDDEDDAEYVIQAVTTAEDDAGDDVASVELDPAVIDSIEQQGEALEASEWAYSNPQFNWLPEGFTVENPYVDLDYQDYNCTLANAETGENLFIDIAASYASGTINHYAIAEDGSYEAVQGTVLNEEIGADYTMYSLDDGTLSINVFPSTESFPVEDLVHILTSITF